MFFDRIKAHVFQQRPNHKAPDDSLEGLANQSNVPGVPGSRGGYSKTVEICENSSKKNTVLAVEI